MKRIAAVNHNGRRAVTLNLRAHRAQAVREIHHFRLTRGVFNHRAPSARTAAIMMFSVPVTVTISVTIFVPCSRPLFRSTNP